MELDVKQLRNKLGLSQKKLSELTKIPKGRINNWEQGRGNPKGDDSRILERLLNPEVSQSKSTSDAKQGKEVYRVDALEKSYLAHISTLTEENRDLRKILLNLTGKVGSAQKT